MKNLFSVAALSTYCLLSVYSVSAAASDLKVSSASFENGGKIPEKFAFCAPDGKGKTKNGGNISPEISWSGAPKETRSFVLVAVDPDVPAKFDDANKEGKTISEDFPRQDFYHWVLINIPANVNFIKQGSGKEKGKPGEPVVNDYATFMKDKPAETFLGYDGPCPPWNDKRIHNYHFKVYALDTDKIETGKGKSNREIAADIENHVVASGEVVGTFTNYAPKQ